MSSTSSCQAKYHTIPGEDSKHFCPLYLVIRVTKENIVQSSIGWTNVLPTWRRYRARSASILSIWSPNDQQVSIHGQYRNIHLPAPLLCGIGRNPILSLQKDRYCSGVGQVSYHTYHTLSRDKRAFTEHETRRYSHTNR